MDLYDRWASGKYHRSNVENKSPTFASSMRGSVDANATRIIEREGIILKNNIKSIRLVLLIFTLVEATELKTRNVKMSKIKYTYSSVPNKRPPAY